MAVPAPQSRFATPEDLVQQLKTLPPAPRIILKLQQLAASEVSTVDDLVALIRVERALAARIVRIANSPAYNPGIPCESIEAAVQRLGFSEVHHLALIVAGCEILSSPLAAYALAPHTLWTETVACALAAEHIARLVGEDHHLAYTTGLMHGVGMIVINQWVRILAPGTILVYEDVETEWSRDERRLVGYDQADTGAALLRAWDFPALVVEAVRYGYSPQNSVSRHRLAAILAAARWLRTLVCDRTGAPLPAPGKEALLILRLSEEQLRECAEEVLHSVNKAREIVGA